MKQNNIKEIIKKYFFLNPTTRLRVRQIERTLHVPLPSVIRYIKLLKKEGIVKCITIAGVITYCADRTSKTYLLEKKLFNISLLFSSGAVNFIIQELSNPPIILFGSFSKGEDVETSDIDLYIETPSKKKIHLEQFEKKLQRKIQLFAYNNIHALENKQLANNIVNGVILHGYIEVF